MLNVLETLNREGFHSPSRDAVKWGWEGQEVWAQTNTRFFAFLRDHFSQTRVV